jgi:glycosyltransferase involved in cell wall biosynthesis
LWQLAKIFWVLRHERIELIQCNEHDHFPLMRIPARWLQIPCIVTARFVMGRDYIRWLFRPPYRPARVQFTSVSQLESCRAALLEQMGEDHVSLIMNGRSFERFVPRSRESESLRREWGAGDSTFVIGTASTIRPRKRLEDFVDLIARVVQAGENVIGVIAGGGRFGEAAYEQTLRVRIREHKLQDRCRMLGNLTDIAPFMAAIDLMVSTSEMETFGMSVCEAMACGKPVIAYDSGSVSEIVNNPWCMVPFGDLDLLTERALTLIRDPCRYQKLAAVGEHFVRGNFDASVLGAKQAVVYEQVLGRPLSA